MDRPASASDDDESADRRDDDADVREADADTRERQIDARERVLDRWEAEIAARAAAFDVIGDGDEEARGRARDLRAFEREQRRDQAEARRDAAIERDIRRARRAAQPSPTDAGGSDASSVFAELATALQTNPPLAQVLELILVAGVDSVPGCAAVSVVLANRGRLETAASTAPWAADLDAAQLEFGCGPLPMAARDGTGATDDLRADPRWPRLAGLPRTTAARGVASFGLVVGGEGTGVLTLYSEPGGFGPHAINVGEMLAAHASAALARTLDRLTFEAQADAWQHALASRDLIGQAKGILMERRSVDAADAFNLLRETSQRLNIKLRDVADHLVSHRELPGSRARPPQPDAG